MLAWSRLSASVKRAVNVVNDEVVVAEKQKNLPYSCFVHQEFHMVTRT